MAAPKQTVSLLVLSDPTTPELEGLKQLPASYKTVATGKSLADLKLSDEELGQVDVLLVAGGGKYAAGKENLREVYPKLKSLKWFHVCYAGIDHVLIPEVMSSAAPLTNAKGSFSHSLAEYTLFACKWFALDGPRMRARQLGKEWDQYNVEELRGRTMGIVGFGDIGQACGRLAKAFGMRVAALRRRPLSPGEGGVDVVYRPDQLLELMAASDYVVLATPYTPETDKLISADAIGAMKPTGVFVNVGRGKCVDEHALTMALEARMIRGAALDVYETEPLAAESPLWSLPNVFMSFHNADRTTHFMSDAVSFFVENAGRFARGEPLQNVCDKVKGY